MAKTPSRAADLEKMIRQLRADRQAHVDAIAQIDATFARFGITADDRAGSRRGRKPGRPKAAKAVKEAGQFLQDRRSVPSRSSQGRQEADDEGNQSALEAGEAWRHR